MGLLSIILYRLHQIHPGLLVVLSLCLPGIVFGKDLQGRVIAVADGDTITLLDSKKRQHKIRLAGIDAPEKAQPFGQRSKQSLSNMVYGKTVTVDVDRRDRYRRWVGKVLVDGSDVNLQQVRSGMAWHYKAYQAEQPLWDRVTYAWVEQEARKGRRGLWGDTQPVPPWEWRRVRR